MPLGPLSEIPSIEPSNDWSLPNFPAVAFKLPIPCDLIRTPAYQTVVPGTSFQKPHAPNNPSQADLHMPGCITLHHEPHLLEASKDQEMVESKRPFSPGRE